MSSAPAATRGGNAPPVAGSAVQRELITGAGAWMGPEIQHEKSWIHRLDAATVNEIDAALARVKRARIRIPFAADAFPLPRFAAELDRILEEVENGRGFVLLRGIPRSRYTDEECALIYWGLAA